MARLEQDPHRPSGFVRAGIQADGIRNGFGMMYRSSVLALLEPEELFAER